MNKIERMKLSIIRTCVERCYDATIDQNTRVMKVAMARKVFWYLARNYTPGVTLLELAEYANRCNHATVINGINKVKGYIDTDRHFREIMLSLINEMSHAGMDAPPGIMLIRDRISKFNPIPMIDYKSMCERLGVRYTSL